MNKKTAIVAILIIFGLVVVGLLWWYFKENTNPTPTTSQPSSDNTGSLDPFGGSSVGSNTDTGGQSSQNDTGTKTVSLARVRKLTTEPTAGGTIFVRKNKTLVRYIERATGHVYEADTDSEEIRRVSNTTIPKIYTAYWNTTGQSLVLQYLKEDYETVITFAAKLANASSSGAVGEGTVQGAFLPENIRDVVINPSENRVAYLLHTNQGSTITTASFDGSNKKITLASPAREWLLGWPKENALVLTTKPSGLMAGFAYTLNLDTGTLTKIIDGVTGLTTLFSPKLDLVLVGDSARGTTRLFAYNTIKNEYTNLNQASLPEKCIWSRKESSVIYCAIPKNVPQALYPDAWYQGLVLFSDDLWKINVTTGTAEKLIDLAKEGGEAIDGTMLSLDDKEQFLFLINKQDLTPWVIALK